MNSVIGGESMSSQDFKDSPVGRVPVDWDVVRLGDVVDIRKNKNNEKFEKAAFISMEDVSDSKIFVSYKIKGRSELKSFNYCKAGDLLLAKITPSFENGKQGFVPSDVPQGFAFATTEVYPLICLDIDPLFLFYLLKFPKLRKRLEFSMRGTTGRQRVPKDSLEKLNMPYPPLEEQERIAGILRDVDNAIEKVDQAIEVTEKLKRGLMQKLLTEGINHAEFKDSPVGRVPFDWDVVRLGDISSKIKAGGTPLTSNKEYYGGDIPFAKIEDISQSGKYLYKTKNKITQDGLDNSNAWLVPPKALLMAIYGSLGSIAITKAQITTNQAILAIILKDGVADVEFLYYLLLYYKNYIKRKAKHTTQANLTAKIVKNLKIPLPPLEEQERISGILRDVDRRLELLNKIKEVHGNIKQGLMNDLLTGKRRVKIPA